MEQLAVTWWGHASATVELGDTRVALDPLLSSRLAHLRRYAPRPADGAADADLVLISHLHHDHLHLASLRRFRPDVPIVVPRGGERLLRRIDGARVVPAAPGESLHLGGARVDVLPATHDGRRGPWSRAAGPALGFRVEGAGRSLWYPGDTELRDDMVDLDPVDLALVPVGGWGPTLADGHLDPVDGAVAVGRVGATWAVPIHWGTFWPIGLRHLLQANHYRLFTSPGKLFAEALADRGAGARAVPARHGERIEL
jgi:L-ascorbate metabolism protein UlaG (beta-lactamase superfamily)